MRNYVEPNRPRQQQQTTIKTTIDHGVRPPARVAGPQKMESLPNTGDMTSSHAFAKDVYLACLKNYTVHADSGMGETMGQWSVRRLGPRRRLHSADNPAAVMP